MTEEKIEERKFILTESKREEIINLIKNHSYLGTRNLLYQLEEIKENIQEVKKEEKENE